jgi:Tol biopolymer transport system component/DNA-binding CsgD family transcriptional regulator
MGKRGRPPHPDILTPREWEVLALLRENLTNREIAERLGVTLHAARYHVSQIISKLGVTTREEAAAWRPAPEAPAPEPRRRWWAPLLAPAALAKAALGAISVSAVGGLGLLAWGVVETSGDAAAGEGIIFVSDESGNHEIWVMSADGSNSRQLTRMPPNNSSPSWSQDGRQIVFNSSVGDEGEVATFVMDSDGENVRQVLEPAVRSSGAPRFIGDEEIHFSRGDLVLSVQQDGGRQQQLGVIGTFPLLSPDGRRWAYTKSTLGRRDGVLYEARLSVPPSKEWVVLSRGWDYGFVADWSPDGDQLLMSCARNYPHRRPITIPPTYKPPPTDPIGICIVNPDGSGLRQIIREGSNPSWSPDGEWIAYENGEIYVARADGSEAHAITSCGCQVSQPDWGP